MSNSCALAHTNVTAQQARDLIDSTNDLIVVDVREPYEYCNARGHIPGVLNYPWNSGVLRARFEELPADGPLLVVCGSGGRSNAAASFLDSNGFSTVYDMLGGMSTWVWETAPCKYSGGSGTPDDPYQIATAEDLIALGETLEDYDKHFIMTADINLSRYAGTDFKIIGYWLDWEDNAPFSGVFDGNGYTISNFTYVHPDANHVGLFGYVDGPEAEIKDLGLIDPNPAEPEPNRGRQKADALTKIPSADKHLLCSHDRNLPPTLFRGREIASSVAQELRGSRRADQICRQIKDDLSPALKQPYMLLIQRLCPQRNP